MVAILFLGFGFLIFTYLLLTDKVVQKENYAGKNAMETYLGGERFNEKLFDYHVSGQYALEDAFVEHSFYGDHNPACTVDNIRIWYTDMCQYSYEDLTNSFFTVFDKAFKKRLIDSLSNLGMVITMPKNYKYKLDKDVIKIDSIEKLSYEAHNKTYTTTAAFDIDGKLAKDYLEAYDYTLEEVKSKAECLIDENNKNGNYNECFKDEKYKWNVNTREDFMFFTVIVDKIYSITNIEISFAIPLNSLDDISDTEHISF